ncbi:MAG TPA: hypothetical protein DDW54_01300, partial [Clostridiales bacterium]|nr:hypothetical protein [Clostridiales bacterium]
MNNVEYEVKYNEYKRAFNEYAEHVFSEIKTPNNLADSMKYSLFVGGKRIRPVLLISSCENKGISSEKYLPYALAIECIHTYSLIHDDLPALDNDVLRRGNPTNHVKFDEATAILAGDALLNFAYEFLISNCQDENDVKAIKYVAESGGYRGMLSGQKSDKEKENAAIYTENDLSEIYRLKTGRLIACPLVVAELLSGNENIGETENFGFDLGRLFQFADDYKDVFS